MATKAAKTTKTASIKKSTTPAKKTAVKTSKPAAKTTLKTTIPVATKSVETKPQEVKKSKVKIKRSYVILVAIIFAIAAFLFFFRGLFVAAVVNGQPISRVAVVKDAEKQSGKASLSNLIRNTIIEQEAQKQNITVSEKEIDDEIKKVEDQLSKQGQKLDQVLKLQAMTKEDLRKLIKLDKLVGKIVGKEIKVSDKEVAKYIEDNKEMLPKDQKEDVLKKSVAEQLKQQKLNEKVRTWLEDLQKKANIQYFVQY